MNLLFRELKHHVIYLVFSVICAIVWSNQFYLAGIILIFLLYKLPKIRLLLLFSFIFIVSQQYYINNDQAEDDFSVDMAKVIEIKNDNDEYTSSIIVANKKKIYMIDYNKTLLVPGDILSIQGEVKKPTNPTIKHGFNFSNYLHSQNISYVVVPKSVVVIDQEFHLDQWRFQMMKKLESTLSPLTANYVKALFLGEKSDLSEELKTSVSELGVIHLFAISGLHVALLSGILMYLLKRLNVIDVVREIVLIVFLIIFIIISGGSSSVVRAASMVISSILNQRFRLGYSMLDVYSFIFIINSVINPYQVTQQGFIFSYVLTGFLLLSQQMLKLLSTFKIFIFIPFYAQLISLPLQVYYFYQVNLLSYFANLVLVPLFSSFLIPLLLVVIVFPSLSPFTDYLLNLFEQGIYHVSDFLNWNIVYGAISIYILFILYGTILIGSVLFEKRKTLVVWGYVILVLLAILEFNRFIKPQEKLTMLDVGQGDSFIIQSPFQSCKVIVDTGGIVNFSKPNKSQFDNTLKPYLLGEGIREIDFLVLTHGDFDHIGEAKALIDEFKIKYLVVSPFQDTILMDDVLNYAKLNNVNVINVKRGDIISCGNMALTFYHPSVELSNVNDQSLVFKLELGNLSALFTGDISTKVETSILSELNDDTFDIYKVAHHGSASSNSELFLKRINPSLALVSAGRNNTYGHPSSNLSHLLEQLEIPLLNTQISGSVEIIIGKNNYEIEMFSP